MRKRPTILFFIPIVIFIINGFNLRAQDIHFGHFYHAPLIINPAKSGQFEGQWRLNANYRDQWRSITVPYQTYAFSGDYRYEDAALPFQIGAGLYLLNDRAGDGELQTKKMYLSASISKFFESFRTRVSIGTGYGMVQQGLDFSKLIYDRQWTDHGFDPQLATGELSGENQFFYRDWSFGVFGQYNYSRQVVFYGGVSSTHAFRPKTGFYFNRRIATRFFSEAGARIQYFDILKINAALLYSGQSGASEILFGANAYVSIPHPDLSTIILGSWIRASGDFIPAAGLMYRDVEAILTYDFNLYDIRKASKTLGGFELSLQYIIGKPRQLKKIVIPCIRI